MNKYKVRGCRQYRSKKVISELGIFCAKYHEAKPKNMTYNTGITVNGVKLTVARFHELKETLKFQSFR